MPQLNPAPWLFILIITWVVLLVVLFPKVATQMFPNSPGPQNILKLKKQPWNW